MNSVSILLVDDNQTFRLIATDFITRHDNLVVVGATAGAEEALAQVKNLRPEIVLVDLDLSGLIGGVEFISLLRAMRPHIIIIALNVLSANCYRQAALAAGADEMVVKSRLDTDLLPAIQHMLQADRTS